MNKLILILTLFVSFNSVAHVPKVTDEQIQDWVLSSIDEMPSKGGYVLSRVPSDRLRDAFSWNMDELGVDFEAAVPSYCTTSTYLIFYKVLQKYWDYAGVNPSRSTLEMLKPNGDTDGVRIWGRWNSNGPATAKFFYDTEMGENFDDINLARPGDFLKMFWNGQVGKLEAGHSVVYLGREKIKGVMMIKFWSSNKITDGYGLRYVPVTDAKLMIFSRLQSPQNFENISRLPETDEFLAGMLNRVSNWTEVRKVTGLQPLW